MTRALYHDPHQPLTFSASVVDVQGTEVALAATAFYPESGGQSSDVGVLRWAGSGGAAGEARVTHARKNKATGTIWHRVEGTLPPLGAEVTGEVDPGPRWRHTQRHSAEHLLAQAFRRVNPAFEVASVNMTGPECTIDFLGDPAETHIRAAEALLRETLGREELTLATPVVPEAELTTYPLRRESKVGGQVRLVIFRDSNGEFFDVSACGGTHVPRAAMCAPVVVLRSERVRGGQTRVVFMAGEEASQYLSGVYQSARTLAQEFSAPVDRLPERVAALRADLRRIWEDVTYAPNEKGKLTYQPGPLAAWIRDREIGLEMCPCSNLQTGALPETPYHRHHPVAMLNEMGFCVCVSPDNRLMSGTSMTHEYRMIAESFGYNESEFVGLATTAALQAFLPAREKDDLVAMIGEVYYQHLEKEKARQAEKKAAREAAAAAEKAAVEAAPEPASEPAAVEPAAAEPAESAGAAQAASESSKVSAAGAKGKQRALCIAPSVPQGGRPAGKRRHKPPRRCQER